MTQQTGPEVLRDFPCAEGHAVTDAHRWLERNLLELLPELRSDALHPDLAPLLKRVDAQPPAFQIALLRASIERLPWYRQHRGSWKDANGQRGTVLYELVCRLYQRKLPYTEKDVCEILRLSRHDCGHGGDVTPPFDILLAHARKHGISAELFEAVHAFLGGLKGVTSSKAQHLKRKGATFLLLDPSLPPGKGARACWSDRFRQGVASLSADERRSWQSLVLDIGLSGNSQMPATWRRRAQKFLADLGPERVVARLAGWWPEASGSKPCRVQTGGSNLLKNLVWTLQVVPAEHGAKPACDELVSRLAVLDWKPAGQAAKFLVAASFYLAERPPEVAWSPLQHLAETAGNDEGRIRGIADNFALKHGLCDE